MHSSVRRIAVCAGVCGAMALAAAAVSGAGAATVRLKATRDATIRGGTYASVPDNGPLLTTRLSSNPDFIRRALLDFDTSSAIPAGATVTSATLTLTVHWGGATAARDVAVYDVTTPFVAAQATWEVASATTPWKTPGGDLGRMYAKSAVPNSPGAKATFSVTDLVQAAVSGSHHSLMALVDAGDLAGGRDGYRDYYSSNATDTSLRPALDVTYSTTPPTTGGGLPAFSHVFTIVMENEEYPQIIGSSAAPYLNSLAAQYGLATNYTGVTHPSLPNYMALTGGETVFTSDCVGCTTSATNVVDEAVESGRHWKAYMESMPASCGTTDTSLYAQKHNPFVHYDDIVKNATRCKNHVVPFTQFATDLKAGALPDYVWITPNLCNDMHDCSVSTGDKWLSAVVPQIIGAPAFKNSVLFILWDEGTTNSGGGGRIPALVVSPFTPAGFRWAGALDHYDLLRTIEDAWKLKPLGQSASATAMKEFFTGR